MKAEGARTMKEVGYAELLREASGFKIVVLGGFSGRGYADPEALRRLVRGLVRREGDGVLYVIGATEDGIGAAYRWIPEAAAEFGLARVRTAGIVSSNAREMALPPQDFTVFVPTPPGDWRVIADGRSRMVDIAADSGGRMVYFGGGEVARSEIAEARARGVPVELVGGPETKPRDAGS